MLFSLFLFIKCSVILGFLLDTGILCGVQQYVAQHKVWRPAYGSEPPFVWIADVVEQEASQPWTSLTWVGSPARCRAAVSMDEEMGIDLKSASLYSCTPCQGPVLLPLELLFLFLPSRVSLFAHFSYKFPDLTPLLSLSAPHLELLPSTLGIYSVSLLFLTLSQLHATPGSQISPQIISFQLWTLFGWATHLHKALLFYGLQMPITSKINPCCLKSFLIEVLTLENNPGLRWWFPHGRMVFQVILVNANLKHKQDIF